MCFTTDWTVMQVHMTIRELLPERNSRKVYMAECTGLVTLPGEEKLTRAISPDFEKNSQILLKDTPGSVLVIKAYCKQVKFWCLLFRFTCFTGCFSSRGCDFSHCTHQSWENPSCSGSKNHSPSCSRYDIKWKCEVILYWLQISMLLSFMHSYQEQKRLLPQPTFENAQMSSWNSSSHNTKVWKSVWAFSSCINLEQ